MGTLSEEEKIEIKKKTHKQLMWIGIFSIGMMFAGFSSAYFVMKADSTWVKIYPPKALYISTVILVLSSVTYYLALRFSKQGKNSLGTVMVGLTLVLGLVFVKYQVDGWRYLMDRGSYMTGANIKHMVNNVNAQYGEDYIIVQKGNELDYVDGEFYDKRDVNHRSPVKNVNLDANNNGSSYFYLLTALHVVHLVGGLLSLVVVLFRSAKNRYAKEDFVGMKVSAIYWHFLDFLWLYLLGLLYFVG